ncbi:MAG: NapC/NirT family cytochrome c [Candidatus Solibacter usitatus]|nr:NapC/NirT family cytochrome c [Candidatus Solibacter usitatus]
MANQLPPVWRDRLSPLVLLSNNLISRIGVVLVTTATVFWLFLLPSYLSGHAGTAYIGIVLYLLLPGIFFAGLLIIPTGIYLFHRRLGPGSPLRAAIGISVLSWANQEFRRLLTFVAAATFANIVIAANLTYRAVDYMDSVQFCGPTCHVVMKPEFTAYQNSPHSKVECTKCHIGPGASWFVQSKLSGLRQVFAVAFNTYERPVATPIANLRPARETCEGCHWPDRYGGDRLKIIPHFGDDGTATKSVLLMHIGGGNVAGAGIHSKHVGAGIRVRYGHSDRARQNIPYVEYSLNGAKREFFAANTTQADVAKLQMREMDCVDCHNRPSHTMETPERALDRVMASGEVDAKLAGVRKVAMEVLKRPYPSSAEAEKEIPTAILRAFPGAAKSAQGVLSAWQRNVFPDMKVTWGTYINNLGHNDFPGCFRCHDEKHATADGKSKIGQDCNACHSLLAMEEAKPKILQDLGVE